MLHRPSRTVIKPLIPEGEAFDALVEESRHEGYWMLVRLRDGWAQGRNRFSGRNEMLVGAWRDDKLVGICGLNLDPYIEGRQEGRVRHLYVSANYRHAGVGRVLVWAVIDKARKHFPSLNLRAPDSAFAFYEALGFERIEDEQFATHRMRLAKPTRHARRHP